MNPFLNTLAALWSSHAVLGRRGLFRRCMRRMRRLRTKWHLYGRQQALAELASWSRPKQCCMPWGPRAFVL